MTEKQKNKISAIRTTAEILESAGGDSSSIQAANTLTRAADALEDAYTRLNCVMAASRDSIPVLEDVYRRYGCSVEACFTPKCPHGFPCPASGLRRVIEAMRACAEGGSNA